MSGLNQQQRVTALIVRGHALPEPRVTRHAFAPRERLRITTDQYTFGTHMRRVRRQGAVNGFCLGVGTMTLIFGAMVMVGGWAA